MNKVHQRWPDKIADHNDLGPPVSAKEAVRIFDEEGAGNMVFTFLDFMKFTKLTWPEMLDELVSGRLIASGMTRNGKDLAVIRGTQLIEWMVKTNFKTPAVN